MLLLPPIWWSNKKNVQTTVSFLPKVNFQYSYWQLLQTILFLALISIVGFRPTHIIRLYLDGFFIARGVGSLTLLNGHHRLQAVQVEDSSTDVLFMASSSNDVTSDKWWRCSTDYHKDWFLPSFNDSSSRWPTAYVAYNNTSAPLMAPDAKWIGSIFSTNKTYCRRNTTLGTGRCVFCVLYIVYIDFKRGRFFRPIK